MMRTSHLLTTLSCLILAAPLNAALFSGDGGTFRTLFRLQGSVSGQQISLNAGSVEIDAQLEPGRFTLSSALFDNSDPGLAFTSTQNITDPLTFETSTYNISVTIDRFAAEVFSAPVALNSGAGGLEFNDSSGSIALFGITGSYSILGPSSTVQSPFGFALQGTTNFAGTLSNIDFPSSFDLNLGASTFQAVTLSAPLELFNETIDGNPFSAEISIANILPTGALTLTAVPEPSVPSLVFLSGAALLGRRRRA